MRHTSVILLLSASLLACDGVLGIPDYTFDKTISCEDGRCECLPGHDSCDGTWANGCETSTADDASNCGACSHPCLGGECKEGSCMPATLVTAPRPTGGEPCINPDPADPRRTVGDPVARDGFLYVTYLSACPRWHLERLPITGNLAFHTLTLLDSSSRAALASFIPSTDGSEGYLLGESSVLRVGLDPSAAATPVSPWLGAMTSGDLALAGRCLYATVEGSTSKTRQLMRLDLDNHSSEALKPSIFALAGDGHRVIYAEEGAAEDDSDKLYTLDESCGNPTSLLAEGKVKALTVDSVTGAAYVAIRGLSSSAGNVPLYLISASSTLEQTDLYVASSVDGLAARDGDVYWQSRSGGTIGRAAAGNPEELAASLHMTSRLALDEHRIYWWDEMVEAPHDRSIVAVARAPHR
ncbi:MAG: hypothetical protein ABI134_30020 [Byssovorax sp.]